MFNDLGLHDRAREIIVSALNVADGGMVSRALRDHAFGEIAVEMYRSGSADEAEQLLLHVPRFVRVSAWEDIIASSLERDGRSPDIREVLSRLDPGEQLTLLTNVAGLHLKRGEHREAVDAIATGLDIATALPGSASAGAFYNLGELAFFAGLPEIGNSALKQGAAAAGQESDAARKVEELSRAAALIVEMPTLFGRP